MAPNSFQQITQAGYQCILLHSWYISIRVSKINCLLSHLLHKNFLCLVRVKNKNTGKYVPYNNNYKDHGPGEKQLIWFSLNGKIGHKYQPDVLAVWCTFIKHKPNWRFLPSVSKHSFFKIYFEHHCYMKYNHPIRQRH